MRLIATAASAFTLHQHLQPPALAPASSIHPAGSVSRGSSCARLQGRVAALS